MFSARVGEPVTVVASLMVTVAVTTSPALIASVAPVRATEDTVGTALSTAMLSVTAVLGFPALSAKPAALAVTVPLLLLAVGVNVAV